MLYTRTKYPDGQISAKITQVGEDDVTIKERINSYEDLVFVMSLAQVLDRLGVKKHLEIPCLFGQRSDRRFSERQSFDLKIIADMINSCNFETVTIHDPHSMMSIALINRSYIHHPNVRISEAIQAIGRANLVLISPDAGAYKKVFEIGTNEQLPVGAAVKHRDLEGKIDLQFIGDVKGKDCLIVDDLCDGGYTFIILAKKLKEQGAKRVFLYISHAYFSKGLEVLKESIDHVFCTNSVKDIEDPFVTQFKVI